MQLLDDFISDLRTRMSTCDTNQPILHAFDKCAEAAKEKALRSLKAQGETKPVGEIVSDGVLKWASAPHPDLPIGTKLYAAPPPASEWNEAPKVGIPPQIYDALKAAKQLLLRELNEPGRSVFWKVADALALLAAEPQGDERLQEKKG